MFTHYHLLAIGDIQYYEELFFTEESRWLLIKSNVVYIDHKAPFLSFSFNR